MPDTCKNPPQIPGKADTEYSKAFNKTYPGNYLTTITLLIILEITEYLSQPGWIAKLLRIDPEFIIQASTS